MKNLLRIALLPFLLCRVALLAADFHDWAPRPPMGWNSWDNFATAITETQAKAQADFMAEKLKSHGWEYLVVDIQWYEPGAKSHDYRKDATLTMDAFGRLLPARNRFPSAVDGAGFKPLADYVHGLGLKFGIHLMRGIPRQAVEKNLPIAGTDLHAADIADRDSICPWNPDMYGVNTKKPGAQAYYDSVFSLIASWGVDYVKVDDIARPYHPGEVEAIRAAIDRTGRPIVLSLSPGETTFAAAAHVNQHANLWRISDDFWDAWPSLHEQFGRLARWNPYRLPGAWPDADMLPLGVIDLGRRTTHFTGDEQRTLMTLWSIARSPLMHGGDLLKTDAFTLSLLTNDDVLAVNQASANNRPLFDHDNLIAWIADVPGSPDKYLALFNACDQIALDPAKAAYRSELLTRKGKSTTGPVEIAVTGVARLVLVIDDGGDGNASDRGVWMEPTLIDAEGKETRLTARPWRAAGGGWGQVSTFDEKVERRPSIDGDRGAFGIAGHARCVVEYDLPPDCVTFRVRGGLDSDVVKANEGATIRLLVFTGKPDALTRPGLPVATDLTASGFPGGARIRDLWTGEDLGDATGTFAPVIPWHGAGLYRLSPR